MKPTSPEDRELEEMRAEVSERYRSAANDEPPPRLDAKILEAARAETRPARRKREWQVPASIAAVMVLAVTLGLAVRDHEPPFDSMSAQPAREEAKLAKPAAPQLAMKAQSRQKVEADREARPSRERSERPDRQLLAARDEAEKAKQDVPAAASIPAAGDVADASPPAAGAPSSPTASAPAASAAPRPPAQVGVRGFSGEPEMTAKAREQADAGPSASGELQDKKLANASVGLKRSESMQALRKQEEPPPAPQDWIRRIEDLLRQGKQADARDQLLAMRRQYPAYPLPEALQALLGESLK